MAETMKRKVFRWRKHARPPGTFRPAGCRLTYGGEVVLHVVQSADLADPRPWRFYDSRPRMTIYSRRASRFQSEGFPTLDAAKDAGLAWCRGEAEAGRL